MLPRSKPYLTDSFVPGVFEERAPRASSASLLLLLLLLAWRPRTFCCAILRAPPHAVRGPPPGFTFNVGTS